MFRFGMGSNTPTGFSIGICVTQSISREIFSLGNPLQGQQYKGNRNLLLDLKYAPKVFQDPLRLG